MHDFRRGLIVYCRIYPKHIISDLILTFDKYAGVLKLHGGNNVLLNVNRGERERVQRLAQVAADDMIDINEVRTGDIAAIFGLKYLIDP